MEKTGCWKLKEEELTRILWGTRFGRVCGAVVKICVDDDNDLVHFCSTKFIDAIGGDSVINGDYIQV